ncbi:hypothetical protein [Mucilaginibacter kameinonensis]|uniref:hypothetical protein n=1 Tax=Mucilaginibacter kameinonensis TaxID=452286 RepID=UPI000EF7FA0A|nr:hypothetical protein [Mucilaginibacter kameinonensis]
MKKLIPIALLLFSLAACSDDEKANKKPELWQAYTVAQVAVKAHLKDPDGAEFIEGNRKEKEYPDSSYVFRGYVKATNDLGLKAPIEYNVGIKWKGGDWMSDTSWTIKFGTVGGDN